MTATYKLITFSDLYNAVREELKIQSTDTTTINRIKRDLNIIQREVVGAHSWWWLKGSVDLQTEAFISAGTVSVTQDSNVATLSIAIASSKTGYKFSIDGVEEIYTIDGHTAGSATVTLDGVYTGGTNATASYKIWKNRIPLPSDAKETTNVWQDYINQPMESMGMQEFRRTASSQPKYEGKPRYYSCGDFVDPLELASSSIPALTTRASSGIIKTLIFTSSLPATVAEGTRLKILTPGNPTYAGEVYVASVSTTSLNNDTITYTGRSPLNESAIADTTMSVNLMLSESNISRYRELYIHPALSNSRTTLHVDYLKEIVDMSDDDDEPVMPVDDRSVLLYGALERAWMRERNPEASAQNGQKFNNKLAQMAGKLQDTFDQPRLAPSRRYLSAKRSAVRGLFSGGSSGSEGFAGGGSPSITGAINTVAAFDSQGMLGSSPVTRTELTYIQGASSNLQTQINAITAAEISSLTGDVTATGPGAAAATVVAVGGSTAAAVHSGELLANAAVSTKTNGAIVKRDGAGAASLDVTGNLTGDVTGNLTGNVTGNVSGTSASITGNLTGDVTSVGMSTSYNTTVPLNKGGTGQTTKAAGFDALQPMTTSGDVIYGGASGTGTRLPKGSDGQILTLASGLPSWANAGATTAPTLQKFTSGSGTYTRPTSPTPLYIKVRMVGAGGGGDGSGSGFGGGGGNGGDTTFGSSLLVANGGTGGAGHAGGAGGTASLGSGPIGTQLSGGTGGDAGTAATVNIPGGMGACSPFGGAGSSGQGSTGGHAAIANSGSGGGGAGASSTSVLPGGGGGAGGYVDAIITSPSSTYSYAIGAAGAAGSAGSGAGAATGGAGGSGYIEVTEYYQ